MSWWSLHRRSTRISAALAAVALVGLDGRCFATPYVVEVKNDSYTGASSVTICECFIPGDQAGAWLTAPVNGDIVAVEILWKSFPLLGLTTIEQSLSVLAAGTFPVPGAPLLDLGGSPAVIVGPQLTEGILNTIWLPNPVPVSEGQEFVVSLEFQNATDGGGVPDVVWDHDGCQAGKNVVFDSTNTQWQDACVLGVTGDWVIRALVACGPECPESSITGGMLALIAILAAVATVLRLRFITA